MELGTDAVRTQSLRDVLPKLGESDRAFARDLLANYARRGDLSEKQWLWVFKLIDRATTPQPPAPTESVGDFAGVIKLFKAAKLKLKYPKIQLQTDRTPVQLSIAGAYSKYQGQVQVTDGRPYGQNVWFGRVDEAGTWTQGRSASEEDLQAIRQLLREFSQDPAGVAKKHGRLTGRCCFCNTALTDERSTAAGFGPVCAKNYGLESEWKAAVSVLEKAAA